RPYPTSAASTALADGSQDPARSGRHERSMAPLSRRTRLRGSARGRSTLANQTAGETKESPACRTSITLEALALRGQYRTVSLRLEIGIHSIQPLGDSGVELHTRNQVGGGCRRHRR